MNKSEKPPCKNCISYPICVTKLYSSKKAEKLYNQYKKLTESRSDPNTSLSNKKLKQSKLTALKHTLAFCLIPYCNLLSEYCWEFPNEVPESLRDSVSAAEKEVEFWFYNYRKIQKVGQILLCSYFKIIKNKTKNNKKK